MRAPVPIRQICRRLEAEYGNPSHGNKRNPLNELVYIILSTRTRDSSFQETYRRLKRAFPSWQDVTRRDTKKINEILEPGGLGKLKTKQLLAIFRALRRRFGYATLAPLRHLSDREAERFLTFLPGVAKKVAKCVMMYSFRRQVLPVDVHVHRLAERIGLKSKRRPDTSQDLIEFAIPPELRYGFHVNVVAHGRAICVSNAPKCRECCINRYCAYPKKHARRALNTAARNA